MQARVPFGRPSAAAAASRVWKDGFRQHEGCAESYSTLRTFSLPGRYVFGLEH